MSEENQPYSQACRKHALSLISTRRTMVLSTSEAMEPWAAPVYYVFIVPGFYFFSNPDSRHIHQAIATGKAAAAIFYDSDQWEEIQGLQMSGAVTGVFALPEQIKATYYFIKKFPFSKLFLRTDGEHADGPPRLGEKVKLYRFTPLSAFYVNNRLAFGQRQPIDLGAKASC